MQGEGRLTNVRHAQVRQSSSQDKHVLHNIAAAPLPAMPPACCLALTQASTQAGFTMGSPLITAYRYLGGGKRTATDAGQAQQRCMPQDRSICRRRMCKNRLIMGPVDQLNSSPDQQATTYLGVRMRRSVTTAVMAGCSASWRAPADCRRPAAVCMKWRQLD